MVSEDVKLLELIFDGSIKPTDLKFSALESITQNFAEERVIDEGGFSTVYKGILRNGEVAVKRINNKHTINEKLFHREVNSLLNVSHKNIVRFLGFCSHTNHKAFDPEGLGEYILAEYRERILCFEYINNGSLKKYIADELRGLPWDARVLVIKGICEGLQYLHIEKHIIHRDLKPANILIDINMVAKITDFGLSRMEKNAQTKSTGRISSPGYTAPEYIDKGEMSPKYDVYSLGIIIIELVTGSRNIPDSNNVLRRWRHRLLKSGKETPFIYQQIANLIEIGLLCQEKDPYKRPSISDIIRDINELESIDRQISYANESMAEKIRPYLEDDMLDIEPLELCFPFELNNQISSSIELTNKTNAFIAFNIQTTSPLPYFIQPKKDIVAPRSKYSVNITLQSLDKAPQDRGCIGNFIVRSTKVNESLISEDITDDTFKGEEGKLVDEVNLTITYKAEVPQVDVSIGSLTISDKRNFHGPQESDVRPTQAESKIISSTSVELIKFEPPELSFPFLPSKCLLSSIKIVNITGSHIGFNTNAEETNVALYITEPQCGVLPPWSTQELVITRVAKEETAELETMQCKDKYFVWSFFVAEDVKTSDLTRYIPKTERKELPIVFTETSSNELIKFNPPELCLPLLPDQRLLSSTKIINITDQYIGFRICTKKSNSARYIANPSEGILPPLSTKALFVTIIAKEKELEESQCKDKFLLWNGIVTENMKASDVIDNMSETKCAALPIVLTKTSSLLSDDLVQFDPPELHFPFLPNKKVLTSIKIVNLTDYNVGFNTYSRPTNAAWYHTEPTRGILRPRSTQRLMVTREQKENALKDNQFDDNYFVWKSIVSDGVKDSELSDYMAEQESKELPIVLDKINSSISGELIQLDPAEICIPALLNKTMLFSVNVINTTDFYVAFNVYWIKRIAPRDRRSLDKGILPPQSTKKQIISWTTDEIELEAMEPSEDLFVWNRVVSENVESGDIISYMDEEESKKLPLILTKAWSCTSDELTRFDPPELSLPFVPSKSLVFSINLVNNTDYCVGFRRYHPETNVGSYCIKPVFGVLPPRSTQRLIVKSVSAKEKHEDMQCEDKLFLWNGVVCEGVQASDLASDIADYMSSEGSKELPIVYKKTSSSISDELIQFYPPDLQFPLLPNKKVLSSINIVNLTDHNVGFNAYVKRANAAWYHTEPPRGILPPRSTQKLMVTREQKEDALKDNQFDDKYFVWNSIVSDGVKDNELIGNVADQQSKELPIILNKISSSISGELIQLDPAELCLPALLNTIKMFNVSVVNTTDFYVAFHAYGMHRTAPRDRVSMEKGILPPRSTKTLILSGIIDETVLEAMEPLGDHFVWNHVVTERVESGDISSYMVEEESKKLPFVLTKASPCTSNELIQFDPPELSLPFMPNKSLVFSINIVNNTDYCVCLKTSVLLTNVGIYSQSPLGSVMSPRSTQRLVLKRTAEKKEEEDMQCKDKIFLSSILVSEGFEVSDVIDYIDYNRDGGKEFPIVYKMTSSCTSDELIQLDPPQLLFPFLTNKSVSTVGLFKIVNVTDHSVGFNMWSDREDNSAWYIIEPLSGILPPQTAQTIKVTRTLKETVTQDMQCQDKIFVWNGIVTKGVEASDVKRYWKNGDKELPVVLTKASRCDELIQFDPPELSLPFMPKKPLVFSINLVNNTDYCVGFVRYHLETNVGVFYIEPASGVMPPQSAQRLVVKRVPGKEEQHDMQCKDKFFLWSSLVSEGVQASDIFNYTSYRGSKEFPIVYKKTSSSISDDLIQFDPPDLHFPILPNKKVLSSIKIVNLTDHNVGFHTWIRRANAAMYYTTLDIGILPPRSTQKLIITREQKQDALKDKLFDDKLFVWNGIVSDGVEDSELINYMDEEESKELPIILDETNLCTSDELIQLDPPQLPFPFSTNRSVPSLFRIVNVTDHKVGFSMWSRDDHEDTSAWYITEPRSGILSPQKAQTINVTRILKKNEKEDMQCKDKIFLWNRIVTEGVEVSDVKRYWKNGDKELPIVLTKAKGKKFWKWS